MIIPSKLGVKSGCDLICVAEDVAQLEANGSLQAREHDQEAPLAVQIGHIFAAWQPSLGYVTMAANVGHCGCVHFPSNSLTSI